MLLNAFERFLTKKVTNKRTEWHHHFLSCSVQLKNINRFTSHKFLFWKMLKQRCQIGYFRKNFNGSPRENLIGNLRVDPKVKPKGNSKANPRVNSCVNHVGFLECGLTQPNSFFLLYPLFWWGETTECFYFGVYEGGGGIVD